MATPGYIDSFYEFGAASPIAPVWPLIWTVLKIVVVLLPLMGLVAYLTLWERKLLGWIQIRIGPNRVGFNGILQPIADALKLLFKEIILPAKYPRPCCSIMSEMFRLPETISTTTSAKPMASS